MYRRMREALFDSLIRAQCARGGRAFVHLAVQAAARPVLGMSVRPATVKHRHERMFDGARRGRGAQGGWSIECRSCERRSQPLTVHAAAGTPFAQSSWRFFRNRRNIMLVIGVEIGANSFDGPAVSMPSSQVSRVPPAIGSRR